jgi:uncharacterized membrane protein YfcA
MLYCSNVPLANPRWFRDLSVGLLVGLVSGLFGVGGGIILVPILVLLFRIDQKLAQATSLVVVALSAVTGAITYSIGLSVAWLAVPFLVAGGFLGTWLGTAIVPKIKDRWLKLAFGLFMFLVAGRLVWMSFESSATTVPALELWSAIGFLLAGFAMGLLSSLLGVGGGIIVIPILVTLFGFPQQVAAGTSLVVMIPIALLGAWRLGKRGFTDWTQGLRIGAAASVAAIGGAAIALVADSSVLQLGFALLLVLAGSQMIWRAIR